jgi:hypothetical protein
MTVAPKTRKAPTDDADVIAKAIARHGWKDVLAAINLLISERQSGHTGARPLKIFA